MKSSVLTLVGADQPGIVAAVTDVLFKQGCNLAQASMMQLGANFAIMLRVSHQPEINLRQVLAGISESMNLHIHIDEDVAENVRVTEPDVQITVYGADRTGIVAQVTAVLAEAGLNIVDLETDVAGSESKPIYIMTMEGTAKNGVDALRKALEGLNSDIEVNLDEITTLRG
ncbi:hypothetical protein MNBD_GAMMA09-3027 [hydrothermal vent metagenome]|uniref:ACT domain-containing protein n=1 Tax=hydrothermal vent metagenome TaxID=652676 RepID=A0A3B0XHK8_9ZZZZ